MKIIKQAGRKVSQEYVSTILCNIRQMKDSDSPAYMRPCGSYHKVNTNGAVDMSRIQKDKLRKVSRRLSPSRTVVPHRTKSSRAAKKPLKRENASRLSTITNKTKSKKIIVISPDDHKFEHKDLLRKWMEPSTVAFSITIFVSLGIGVASFAKTGNLSIFFWLTPYVAAFSGVPEVTTIISRLKDKIRG